jgi:hypothetical protein
MMIIIIIRQESPSTIYILIMNKEHRKQYQKKNNVYFLKKLNDFCLLEIQMGFFFIGFHKLFISVIISSKYFLFLFLSRR